MTGGWRWQQSRYAISLSFPPPGFEARGDEEEEKAYSLFSTIIDIVCQKNSTWMAIAKHPSATQGLRRSPDCVSWKKRECKRMSARRRGSRSRSRSTKGKQIDASRRLFLSILLQINTISSHLSWQPSRRAPGTCDDDFHAFLFEQRVRKMAKKSLVSIARVSFFLIQSIVSPRPLAEHPRRPHLDVGARADCQQHDRQERVEVEERRHCLRELERERAGPSLSFFCSF